MKYFLSTKFLNEYTSQKIAGVGIPTWISKPLLNNQLISIGIVSGDILQNQFGDEIKHSEMNDVKNSKFSYCVNSKEYYTICKEFDIKAAWNNEWLRENVLCNIYNELIIKDNQLIVHKGDLTFEVPKKHINKFRHYKNFKRLINKYGKTREQIAEEIKDMVLPVFNIDKNENTYWTALDKKQPEFYAYYADYDHVCLEWLYGRMIDLPVGFPQYTKDIQQLIDDNNIDKDLLLKEVQQINCHNSLQNAIWNKKAFNYIQNKINESDTRI